MHKYILFVCFACARNTSVYMQNISDQRKDNIGF